MLEIKTNAETAGQTLEAIAKRISELLPQLFTESGRALVKDVQDRIQSQDHNTWALASKWVNAKKGTTHALKGIERFIFYRLVGDKKLELYGKTDGKWTISQHHEGFENKLADEKEKVGERVRLKIVNPGPLGLSSARDFYFIPKHAGKTPARKIWPTTEDAAKVVYPVGFRWLRRLVLETPGVHA